MAKEFQPNYYYYDHTGIEGDNPPTIISLPEEGEHKVLLQAKLEEYAHRIMPHAYDAPELRNILPDYLQNRYSHAILEVLCSRGSVNARDIHDQLLEEFGEDGMNLQEFNHRVEVVGRYATDTDFLQQKLGHR